MVKNEEEILSVIMGFLQVNKPIANQHEANCWLKEAGFTTETKEAKSSITRFLSKNKKARAG